MCFAWRRRRLAWLKTWVYAEHLSERQRHRSLDLWSKHSFIEAIDVGPGRHISSVRPNEPVPQSTAPHRILAAYQLISTDQFALLTA